MRCSSIATCLSLSLLAASCAESAPMADVDAGVSDATLDTGTDAGVDGAVQTMDAEVADAQSVEDSGATDSGVTDASRDLGPLPDFGVPSCRTDADCPSGLSWCVGGSCVACDNSAVLCDIACSEGTELVERNGCTPCECIPSNECTEDADCIGHPLGSSCLQGKHCPDWCPPDDPSCCLGGNTCRDFWCGASPAGCVQLGCPYSERCDTSETSECLPSSCYCHPERYWACTSDCAGGICVPR